MSTSAELFLDVTPDENPLAMPPQSLLSWELRKPPAVTLETAAVRAVLVILSSALTVLGTWGMYKVISPVNITWLQLVFASLFALTFAWISFSCVSAVIGFFVLLLQRSRPIARPIGQLSGRTAILMPVYNENPEVVFANLKAMARELIALSAGKCFEIFILSDTRSANIADVEAGAFKQLRAELSGEMPCFYRRRVENSHRKAGNVADFVRRWGGRYDYMIVLDADSYMSGETMITLVRSMNADAYAGLIQTVPLLRKGDTAFARMLQFVGRVYGPVVSAGLSAWHGQQGNFWGHNAIIRCRAFAESAGLPELPGKKPFGGHILSHDFVEAALLIRSGWGVYMLPTLGGSYEEPPPSLVDMAVRDRRWSQGNLQHMKVLNARGLHWISRVHLIQGIMAYVASPLWLLLLATGLVLAVVARYAQPNYFPEGFSLFPVWPVFDPDLALRLLGLTAFVLYLPKALGLILTIMTRELRDACGGTIGLLKGVALETLLSILLSPLMMFIHSRLVLDMFLGRDAGWSAQNRSAVESGFAYYVGKHWAHVAIGVICACVTFSISWATFLWFLPINLGLVLAPIVSWVTALPATGAWLSRKNVFRTPEEWPLGAPAPLAREERHLEAAE